MNKLVLLQSHLSKLVFLIKSFVFLVFLDNIHLISIHGYFRQRSVFIYCTIENLGTVSIGLAYLNFQLSPLSVSMIHSDLHIVAIALLQLVAQAGVKLDHGILTVEAELVAVDLVS